KKLWPPALDHVTVDKGYEAALGAALGDDLEAPIDPSAPMRWAGAALDAADPALPDGVAALGDHVKAAKQLARRLAQIGVIKRDEAARFMPMLKPGQRLVSREGDLWRWDGFSVAADAPAAAARGGGRRRPPLYGRGHEGRAAGDQAQKKGVTGGGGRGRRRRPSRGCGTHALARAAARVGGRARAACRGRARGGPQRGAAVG